MKADDLYKLVVDAHRKHFGVSPQYSAFAPGRIEVLGNHTDYNEGYVLSAAIDEGVFFTLSPLAGGDCRLRSIDLEREASFPAGNAESGAESWANYVMGVWRLLVAGDRNPPSFAAGYLGSLPFGSGLSSSAALEVSAALAFAALQGKQFKKMDLADLCCRAENEYAGVNCGLLDQVSSLFGEAGRLMAIDFRTLQVTHAAIPAECRFVVCNTHVKHKLVDSEYNLRRQQCEAALRQLSSLLGRDLRALRDVSPGELERCRPDMSKTEAARATHVIYENHRVLEGIRFLRQGDLPAFGSLMYASHESSRVHFENSAPELDFLVDEARDLAGVYGARLSGGGFGGNVAVLAAGERAREICEELQGMYRDRFDRAIEARVLQPADGARLITADGQPQQKSTEQ